MPKPSQVRKDRKQATPKTQPATKPGNEEIPKWIKESLRDNIERLVDSPGIFESTEIELLLLGEICKHHPALREEAKGLAGLKQFDELLVKIRSERGAEREREVNSVTNPANAMSAIVNLAKTKGGTFDGNMPAVKDGRHVRIKVWELERTIGRVNNNNGKLPYTAFQEKLQEALDDAVKLAPSTRESMMHALSWFLALLMEEEKLDDAEFTHLRAVLDIAKLIRSARR